MSEQKEMSFFDHLEELRWRLVRCAVAVVAVGIVIWMYQEWIYDHIFKTMSDKNFITYRLMCQFLGICIDNIPLKTQSTTMGGQFGYSMMMSFLGGVVVSFPYIFYQAWSFIKPGLKVNEIKAVRGIVFYVSLLFFTGILFGYFVVAPMCVQFFGSYQISKSVENIFTINSYMSTIISTVFYTGLMFLLPVLIYIFAELGIVTPQFLRKYRKHAIVGVLILAAVITPPDVVSQILVTIPIILLYEIGVLVAARVYKKKREEELKS